MRMAQFPPRDLRAEAAKHFRGTPDERIRMALRLGQEAIDLFAGTLPAGTPRAVVAETRPPHFRGR